MRGTIARRYGRPTDSTSPILGVVDDFYAEPDALRRAALAMTFVEPPAKVIGRRTPPYQPRGIKRRLERVFHLRIREWRTGVAAITRGNGVFFRNLPKTRPHAFTHVHYDSPASWVSVVVYLTPDAPPDAGTSFWQHRETGLRVKPCRREARRLGISVEELFEIFFRDCRNRRRWRELERVENHFNRAVLFRSGALHSATRYFGEDLEEERIYQTFHFPAERLPGRTVEEDERWPRRRSPPSR